MLTAILLLSTFNLFSNVPVTTSLPVDESVPLILFGRALPECINVARRRTAQDIVWSCLATIFVCAWVAIHPNLPGPGDSGWTRFKRRVLTLIYALIAPEFTITWALRQWIAARRILREHNQTEEKEESPEVPWYQYIPNLFKNCHAGIQCAIQDWFDDPRKGNEWTLTHAFFVQMGGFMLYETHGETPIRVLTHDELKGLIAQGKVDAPRISEHAINDRSKGDFLTKLIVVLQTTWFIFQCLVRWASHLPVTELEVVTLAFATLNIIAYALWWKKPQNMLVAVEVRLRLGAVLPSREMLYREEEPEDIEGGWFYRRLRRNSETGWLGWLVGVPRTLVIAIMHPVGKVIYPRFDEYGNSLRVPMFYAEARDDRNLTLYPILTIGIFFGGLHLIPWSSSFPTPQEHFLWRLSAIFVTCYPVVAVLINVITMRGWMRKFPNALSLYGYVLYAIARLILLFLAFTTLRALPDGTYLNIDWTIFIPHI